MQVLTRRLFSSVIGRAIRTIPANVPQMLTPAIVTQTAARIGLEPATVVVKRLDRDDGDGHPYRSAQPFYSGQHDQDAARAAAYTLVQEGGAYALSNLRSDRGEHDGER